MVFRSTYLASSRNMLDIVFGSTSSLDIAEVHLLIKDLDLYTRGSTKERKRIAYVIKEKGRSMLREMFRIYRY